MKNFLRNNSGWIIIILILLGLLFIYYNKASLAQKLSSTPLVIDLAPLVASGADSDSVNSEIIQIKAPVILKIPALKLVSKIEHLGLTDNGEMDVPANPANVAWFNLGPLPGAEGSAVIAGHFDDENGRPAVFSNLQNLKIGDELLIEDEAGITTTFIVQKTRLYKSDAFVPEIFSSPEGQHLNLITCAGKWSKSQNSYAERLVIFAEREEE